MYHRLLFALIFLMGITSPARAQAVHAGSARTACTAGTAAGFGCSGIDLMAFVPRADLGSTARVNDLWGWTDPETGKEYALVGKRDGTAFVDISDPENPVLVGVLPMHEGTHTSLWRDLKTYKNYAYIVADFAGGTAGMQVFDLTRLRTVDAPPATFSETAHYAEFSNAHNIAINEETGFAYVVGSNTCSGGLHIVDLSTPTTPSFAGCFNHVGTGSKGQGYTHDVQCVAYHGPDPDYEGREICVGSNETGLSIADVTDKGQIKALSFATYPNVEYAHQGWFTEDQRYFLSNDESDELSFRFPTRTLIWDMTDLDDPVLLHEYFGPTLSTDHNLYVRGQYAFLANYTSGLRILDISDVNDPREVAFFDTYTAGDGAGYGGAWSSYPFFESGNVIVTSEDEGLFIVQPVGLGVGTERADAPELPVGFTFEPAFPNPFTGQTTMTLRVDHTQRAVVVVYDVLGRTVARLFEGLIERGKGVSLVFDAAALPVGTYIVSATGEAFSASQRLTHIR